MISVLRFVEVSVCLWEHTEGPLTLATLGNWRLQEIFLKGVKSELGPGKWVEVSHIQRKEKASIQQ